jgi:hypothetical protein
MTNLAFGAETVTLVVNRDEVLYKGTKNAWLYVFAHCPIIDGWKKGERICHELYFSSKEKFEELWGRPIDDREALIKVWVPEDFDDWDYIPNDY